MSSLTQLFAVTVFVAGLLGLISVCAPRRLMLRGTALAATALLMPLAYASMVELLSRPKPIDLEWWQNEAAEATVLGAQIKEDQSIHLWLQLPDTDEPRAYVLPWNRETAERLQEAQNEAERRESELKMRLPFEPSLDDRKPRFYAMPQPALPPKHLIDPPAQVYSPPGRDA